MTVRAELSAAFGQRKLGGRRGNLVAGITVAGALLGLLLVALFDLESATRAWDAHAQLASVRRIVDLGGAFYVAGTDHKGPLWLGVYNWSYRIGGPVHVWWVVAAFAVLVAAGTGAAVAGIARLAGAGRIIAIAVSVATAVHLTLGREEYSQVLYSRNLVGLLEATAFWLVMSTSVRENRAKVIVAGILIGLAVQTNPSSAPAGIIPGAVLVAIGLHRGGGWRVAARSVIPFSLAAMGVLASAPLWYLVRGDFSDFWGQWWVYNTYYAKAAGQSMSQLLVRGGSDFAHYYADHPVMSGILVLFVLQFLHRLRSGRGVMIDASLLAWWLAECIPVALSQRFFPHYLILPAVPIAAMGGVMAARVTAVQARSWALSVATVLTAATLILSGGPRFARGFRWMTEFRGFRSVAARHVLELGPDRQRLREEVQSRSGPEEEIYVWTKFPWVYTDVHRRSATRFIENRWLKGEIVGGHGSNWILPGTWKRWSADMRQTPPALIIDFSDDPIPPDSRVGELVRSDYKLVYDDGVQRVFERRRDRRRANGRCSECGHAGHLGRV